MFSEEYNEEKLSFILSDDSMNVGNWEWDILTGKTVFDERWANIIGYTIDELLPTSIETWKEFTHSDDLVKSEIELKRHFAGEINVYEVEARMRHKNGKWIWVLDRGKVVEYDKNGSPSKMVGTHYDITTRKYISILKKQEEYEKMIDNAPFPVVISSLKNGTFSYGNKQAKSKFGFSGNDGKGFKTSNYYVNTTDRDNFIELLNVNGYVFDYEAELYNFSKQKYWALISATITEYNNEPSILISFNDITERKSVYEKLRIEEEKYHLLADTIADVIGIYNIETSKFRYISPSVVNLGGYSVEEALQLKIKDIITIESYDRLKRDYQKLLGNFKNKPKDEISYIHEVELITKENKLIWIEVSSRFRYNVNNEIEIIFSGRDISERKKNEERIEFLYLNDITTGLLNKTAFRIFEENLTKRDDIPDQFAVIYVDIDDFNKVNENFNYHVGDLIINQISQKIKDYTGIRGDVYHYDSDEFMIILKENRFDAISDYVNFIRRLISQQVTINGQIFILTASIGFEIISKNMNKGDLLKNSKIALGIAKQTKNTIRQFNDEMIVSINREAVLENDLRIALEKNEFELYYQPIYNIKSGIIDQAEALIRWNHPNLGLISPLEFIQIAEKTKLILPLTDWVIHEACIKLEKWNEDVFGPLTISVNLSFLTIFNRQDELFNFIKNEIELSGIKPKRLKLEITESSLVQDSVEIIKVFIRLRELGISLVLDDFGTGYSSFAYLKSLPLDIVKIDRSLIKSIEWDQRAMKIVESMISILHGLDIEVTIEGVETEKQFKLLKDVDADYIQGYLFSKPLKLLDFKIYYHASKDDDFLPVSKNSNSKQDLLKYWKNEWNTGNKYIDSQHQELIILLKKIGMLSSNLNNDFEIENENINLLIQKIKKHFKDEIEILTNIGYSQVSNHEVIHNDLIQNLMGIFHDFKTGKIAYSSFLNYVEVEVINSHFLDEDLKFIKFVSSLSTTHPINYVKTKSKEYSLNKEKMLKSNINHDTYLQSFILNLTSEFIKAEKNEYKKLINKALELCGKEFDADRVYIFTYDWKQSNCSNIFEWCAEDVEPQIEELQNVPLDVIPEWVSAHVIGETIFIHNVQLLDESSNLRQILEPQGIQSLLTVPMILENVCYGFIGFDSVKETRIYSEIELNLLRDLSGILLTALNFRDDK